MNKEANNIWNESRTGPRGILYWWLTVLLAAHFLAAMTTTIIFFRARWELYDWGGYFPYSIQQMPALLAVFVGLEIMAAYVSAIAAAFVLYRGGRRIFARPASTAPAAARDLIDNNYEHADVASRPVKPGGPAGHIASKPALTHLPASTQIPVSEASLDGLSPFVTGAGGSNGVRD
jgi:hypothetical protein